MQNLNSLDWLVFYFILLISILDCDAQSLVSSTFIVKCRVETWTLKWGGGGVSGGAEAFPIYIYICSVWWRMFQHSLIFAFAYGIFTCDCKLCFYLGRVEEGWGS